MLTATAACRIGNSAAVNTCEGAMLHLLLPLGGKTSSDFPLQFLSALLLEFRLSHHLAVSSRSVVHGGLLAFRLVVPARDFQVNQRRF